MIIFHCYQTIGWLTMILLNSYSCTCFTVLSSHSCLTLTHTKYTLSSVTTATPVLTWNSAMGYSRTTDMTNTEWCFTSFSMDGPGGFNNGNHVSWTIPFCLAVFGKLYYNQLKCDLHITWSLNEVIYSAQMMPYFLYHAWLRRFGTSYKDNNAKLLCAEIWPCITRVHMWLAFMNNN